MLAGLGQQQEKSHEKQDEQRPAKNRNPQQAKEQRQPARKNNEQTKGNNQNPADKTKPQGTSQVVSRAQ